MSYKSDYCKINIAADGKVREALTNVVARHGWELIDNDIRVGNNEEAVKVRAHESINEVFSLVVKNPESAHGSYDIGIRMSEDGETGDLVFDRYQNSVANEWGPEANGLVKEVILEAARLQHNDTVQSWPWDEYMSRYVKDPETGESLSQEDLMNLEQDILLDSVDCPIAQLI